MKLADVIGALRRRWYIVLAGILLAVGAASYVWTTVPPEYERTGTQLLLPGLATIPEDANPYLFVGGLYQITDVLVRAIGPEDIAEVVEPYPGTNVLVARDQAAGAVVTVTVTASSDAAAAAVLGDMLVVTDQTLEKLQNDQSIPDDERVTLTPLTESAESTVVQKTRLVSTAIAAVALLVVGLGAAVLVDNLLRSRRRGRRSVVVADEDDDVRLDDQVGLRDGLLGLGSSATGDGRTAAEGDDLLTAAEDAPTVGDDVPAVGDDVPAAGDGEPSTDGEAPGSEVDPVRAGVVEGAEARTGDEPEGDAVPDGDAPADDAPADDAPVGDVPADDVPADDAPVGDVPADDVPADDAPAGDVPADDVPVGEAPAGDPPADDVPVGEPAADGVPAGAVTNTGPTKTKSRRRVAVPHRSRA